MIILESEPTLSENYQIVFEGCFENNSEEQMVSCISSEVDQRSTPLASRTTQSINCGTESKLHCCYIFAYFGVLKCVK